MRPQHPPAARWRCSRRQEKVPGMADAIQIIRTEHRTLDRVLSVLAETLDHLSAEGPKPNLDLLFSIVYYVRVFPDKVHHPKEEQVLFPALRRHRPELGPVIEELERQHAAGSKDLDRLDRALKAFDRDYPKGLDALREAGRDFVHAQRQHMGLEEREIIPAAKECLTEEDWTPIHRAFGTNADPLFGENVEAGFRALFAKITR
jgi:branched-chain amino acid transport system ATP-binding protein